MKLSSIVLLNLHKFVDMLKSVVVAVTLLQSLCVLFGQTYGSDELPETELSQVEDYLARLKGRLLAASASGAAGGQGDPWGSFSSEQKDYVLKLAKWDEQEIKQNEKSGAMEGRDYVVVEGEC